MRTSSLRSARRKAASMAWSSSRRRGPAVLVRIAPTGRGAGGRPDWSSYASFERVNVHREDAKGGPQSRNLKSKLMGDCEASGDQ